VNDDVETATKWACGRFDGLRLEQQRASAAASPLQRMQWLEEALTLAFASGAVARMRLRRQQQCDEAWAMGSRPHVHGGGSRPLPPTSNS
jgi:hypothetical protein